MGGQVGGWHCFLGSVAKSATVLGSQNCDSLQFLKLSRVILRNLSPHRLLLSGTQSIIKYPTAWPQNRQGDQLPLSSVINCLYYTQDSESQRASGSIHSSYEQWTQNMMSPWSWHVNNEELQDAA